VTISDDEATELRELRAAANAERERIEAMPRPAQHAYYRKLLALADAGATQEQIAAVLDVSRVRIQQLLTTARAQVE
jgi:DNA-binding transcriptional regulator LsrR (DeoR family)